MVSELFSGCTLVTKIQTNSNQVVYSEKCEVTHGTAQGSCLWPLLFILFCNDIYMLPLLGKLILFADDMTLLESHKNKKILAYSTQHDITLLIDWFRANKLSLNMILWHGIQVATGPVQAHTGAFEEELWMFYV